MELIAINAGHTRRETLDGRSYLVAPMTILKEGVLAGSQGALYYPAGEIAKNPGVWNHVPLTIYHPTDDNGNPTSARSPSVIAKYGVGYVFNDRYDPATNTRHAEAWFDEQKLQQVENRFAESKRSYDPVLPRLLTGQPVELSTGLFTQNDLAANGSHHNGKSYTHVARDYRPDHLAVLPDQVGACSLKDGCGVLRNELCENCGGKGGKPGPCPTGGDDSAGGGSKKGFSLTEKTASPGDKVKVSASAATKNPMTGKTKNHMHAGKSGTVVSHDPSNGSVKVKLDDGGYVALDHRHVIHNSEITMNKDDAIQHLTTNCDCWKNKQDVLANLDEDVVVEMAQKDQELAQNRLVVNAVKERFGDIAVNAMPEALAKAKMPPAEDDEELEEEEIPAPRKKGPPVAPAMNNFTDFLKLPPEQRLTANERQAIAFANGIEAKYRADLLDFVVNAVSADKASAKAVRAIYEKMTTNELETLKGTLPQRPVGSVERQAEMPLINWMGSGFGGPVAPTTNRIDEDDVLVLPK